jgi:hypothetical protein
MNILWNTNLVVVTLLGIAAALPKLMRTPQEVQFFQSVGLGSAAVVAFGILQLAGGVLLIFQKTRTIGAAVVAATFLGSTVMLFASRQAAFGVVSLVPVVMAGFLTLKRTR